MDRRATPPNRVTSPTWGPLPPCKRVHRDAFAGIFISLTKNRSEDLSSSSSLHLLSLLTIVAWISVVVFFPNIFGELLYPLVLCI